MPQAPLLQITPQQGLVAGLFPSVEKTAGPVWKDGSNVLFEPLSIEPAYGDRRLFSGFGRGPKVMVQALALGSERRLYYEESGIIQYWNGTANALIGTLNANGDYDLEAFGAWLLATDNLSNLKLWKNTGTFIDIGMPQFARAKIIRKLQNHVLAYCSNELPNGFHWSDADDPEDWVPTQNNRAGDRQITEFDSEVKAVAQLGGGHGVYSSESMAIVNWVGGQNVFGYKLALTGIGAASKRSIIEWSKQNFGLSQAGIFWTDGTRFEYVDQPAFNRWLRDNVDWSLADEIFGYSDERLGLLCWSVPVGRGVYSRIGLHPTRRFLTRLAGSFTAGSEKQVFEYPFLASSQGIYYASLASESRPVCTLQSNPLDAGAPQQYKQWDIIQLDGTMGGLELQLGYSDDESATPEFTDWMPAARNITPRPRESVYLTINLRSAAAAAPWRLASIKVFGEPAGWVI